MHCRATQHQLKWHALGSGCRGNKGETGGVGSLNTMQDILNDLIDRTFIHIKPHRYGHRA